MPELFQILKHARPNKVVRRRIRINVPVVVAVSNDKYGYLTSGTAMNKNELYDALQSMDLHPGKMLGQNFLVDGNLLDYILRTANINPGDVVLEVGPGLGVLTRGLLNAGAKVFAIEFDHRLCDYLRREIVNEYDKLQLVEADACRVDYASLLDGVASYQAIANLPYSISSIFIAKMLELNFPPQRMIFMLQKEMAMRLTAKTNTSEYGSLSVRTQFLYEVKILRLVPPQVFFPQPEIDSAIVQFKLRNTIPDLLHRKQAGELTRVVFAQKRKQIFKPLLMKYTEAKVLSALTQLEIARTARPAEISPEKYLAMSQLLQNG